MNVDDEESDRRLLASALEKQRLILEKLEASRGNVSNPKFFGGGSDRPSGRPERSAQQTTSVDTSYGRGSRDEDNSRDGSHGQPKGFVVGPAHVFQTPSPDDACDDDEKERRRQALSFEQQQLILDRVKANRSNHRARDKPGRCKPTDSKKKESSSPQIQYKNSKHVPTTARVFQTPSPEDASDEEEQARRRHDLALEQQQLVLREVEASRAKHQRKSCKPKRPGFPIILKPSPQPSTVDKTPHHEGDSLQIHRTSSVKASNEEESDRRRRTLALEQQKVILTKEVEASRLSHQSKNKPGSRKVKHSVVGCLLD
jgi:hypothetical protein